MNFVQIVVMCVGSTKRFPGYDSSSQNYNSEEHRDRILGKHVASYMEHLQQEDDDAYQKQFSTFIKLGVSPENVCIVFMRLVFSLLVLC